MSASKSSSVNPLMALSMGVFAAATGAYVYHKRQKRFVPPVAERKAHTVEIGKHTHTDDLFWLRDDKRKAPAVIRHLERENIYSAAQMEHTTDLQKNLYTEFVSHLKEDDNEVPYAYGPYVYYTVTVKGLNYRRHCRKLAPSDKSIKTIADNKNKEQVILDVNELAKGHVFCSVQSVQPSPDHKLLAFAIDTNGYEQYEIRVLNLETGKYLPDVIPNGSGNLEWSDNGTLYYTTLDDAHRPYRLHRHRLGSDVKADQIVLEEKDERFWVGFYRSLSGEYFFVDTSSKITSEVYYLNTADEAKSKEAKLTLFRAREHEHEYSVDHTAGYFWIKTNADGAKNFKLSRVACDNAAATSDLKQWSPVIAHDKARKIEGLDCFRNHVVVYGRRNGFSDVQILSIRQDKAEIPFNPLTLKFPEQIFTCEHGKNREYDTQYVRVVYESYVTPDTTFDVDLATGAMTRVKELEVPKYDRTLYGTELIHATASDGTQIPISLVFRKDKQKAPAAGTNHVLLYGYGSYGICYDPQYDSKRLSLLDRGVTVATAHIRGGGEMGRLWYESGKWLTKKNTFTDFVAAAEHLIATKYTEPNKLAISGGSAGGLLMGAVINMKPELFKCVLTRVPFVDVMVTMNDPSIPLTVTEYEEWGNPADEKYYEYMKSYSPIDNIKAQAYPAMLVTTGLNDSRVAYWEPVKWVQKLRAAKTDSNPILLKIEMIQGHGGSSARYSYMEEAAYNFGFVLDQLGFKK